MSKFLMFREEGTYKWADCKDITKASGMDIDYVARRLSTTFRFNGQYSEKFKRPYNVANHCVILAELFIRGSKFDQVYGALMHELDEVLIGDVIGPIKEHLRLSKNPQLNRMTEALNTHFGADYGEEIKRYDTLLYCAEVDVLFPGCKKRNPRPKGYGEFKQKHFNHIDYLISNALRLDVGEYIDYTKDKFIDYFNWYK